MPNPPTLPAGAESAKVAAILVTAAREMCRISSEACGVDNEDNWKVYGDDYLKEAERVLEACGALDLLGALDRIVHNPEARIGGAIRAEAIAAIRKATGV